MTDNFKLSRIHLFAGMGLILLVLHFNIYQKKIIDLDEVVYLHLADNMSWYFTDYNTISLFPKDKYPRAIYSSPVFHHPPLYPFLVKILSLFMTSFAAAKTLNMIFMFAGVIYLYLLAEILFCRKTALISSLLLLICPIFLMESNLVHIDQFQAFFLIAALFHFYYWETNNRKNHLYFSAILFALTMLVKFTSPVYFIFPAILVLKMFLDKKSKKDIFTFLIISSLGFLWWLYIIIRFHSLFPVEFVGDGSTILVKPDRYLIEISKRSWWHVWLISGLICPLFFLFYIPGIVILVKKGILLIKKKEVSGNIKFFIYINLALILSILAFSIGNHSAKGHWALRYFIPFYPFVYLLSGWFFIQILKKNDLRLNSWAFNILGISILLMLFTSWNMIYYDMMIVQPVIFYFIPSFKSLLML